MSKLFFSVLTIALTISSCQTPSDQTESKSKTVFHTDSVANKTTDSLALKPMPCANDSLNAIANVMSGIVDSSDVYKNVQSTPSFQIFSANFNKRWISFDSSRLTNLRTFREHEIAKVVKKQTTLFYPFSGPDILHAQTFFPDADNYVMIGLEPVGSLPTFKNPQVDSLMPYYNRVNTSLDAILKFSFFRTVSMSKDLKNAEVDGTLHLLFLFLKRTGNLICSAKPVIIDSLGHTLYFNSFMELKKSKSLTKGVEIKFTDKNNQPKTVSYFSLNAADGGMKQNKGFMTYLTNMGTINTYLKGASYLMHKSYFSMVRNVILNQSEHVIQDDSGIAFHYFTESNSAWSYTFYGSYIRPIAMFSAFYQADLDSTYKQQGSKNIGFGIGYNFRDKNSNFMIATKKH
jgi:hypothetical protein